MKPVMFKGIFIILNCHAMQRNHGHPLQLDHIVTVGHQLDGHKDTEAKTRKHQRQLDQRLAMVIAELNHDSLSYPSDVRF